MTRARMSLAPTWFVRSHTPLAKSPPPSSAPWQVRCNASLPIPPLAPQTVADCKKQNDSRRKGEKRVAFKILMMRNATGRNARHVAQGSTVVKAPVADVFKRWLAFEYYPKFITAIKLVRKLDENHFSASIDFHGE